ncbi:Hypothetical protein A7982_04061 [Minicystis rosea]|nr:Hypothetical protein A7982_04061 [Minicystis rosea]
MSTSASETGGGATPRSRPRRGIFLGALFSVPIVITIATTIHSSSERELAQRFLSAVRRDDAAAARRLCGGRACAQLGNAARVPPDSPLAALRGSLEASPSWSTAVGWNERCVNASYVDAGGRRHSLWMEVEDKGDRFRVFEVHFTRPTNGFCSSD